MEDTVNNTQEIQSVEAPREDVSPVSFPQPAARKKGGIGKFIIIFLGLAILGVIGFLVFKGVGGGEATPTETPSVESISGSSSDTLGSSTSESPSPEPVDKADVSIKVENGTGIAGEAGYLQGILANMGYTKIEVGNADSEDNSATQVTFSADLSQSVIDEITKKLESLYETVKTKTSSTQTSSDVIITTGLRKGSTPKPASTDAPAATTKASSSPTPTATTAGSN